ncbi:MAG: hypothetical protein B6D56_05095 [Candidatus Omnitrophica bacterium 4484_70.1]|nr:MAG: hypothetical protein B6D56_05095 [Candidatus Omnitrophica bacterium 4484_70.1]
MKGFIKGFISGLSPKERKLLYITLSFVFFALFDKLIIRSIFNEVHSVEEKIKSQLTLIKKDLLILKYKKKIMEEDKLYSIFYTKKGLVPEELMATFLSEVEQLAKASEITLTNISPISVEEKRRYTQYKLIIECESNMENLINFIYAVNNAKKPIWVGSYEFSPKNREKYEVKCVLSIYKIILIPGRVNQTSQES